MNKNSHELNYIQKDTCCFHTYLVKLMNENIVLTHEAEVVVSEQ